MCQLIFVNSHKAELNKLLAHSLAREDSRTLNKDGWGIFSKGFDIFKEQYHPWESFGFSHEIALVVTDQPAILHVRSASRNTDVKPEFNHPFETESFVLAHNGTLDSKENLDLVYPDKLDSEVFLLELEKEHTLLGKKDIVDSLQKTMERFTGKFAFLIYEKATDKFYAVRGRTADLHKTYLLNAKDEKVGYVINTAKDELINGVDTALELSMMLGHRMIKQVEPEILPIESIFRLDDTEIVKVGDLKQNDQVYTGAGAGWWNKREKRWVPYDYGNCGMERWSGAGAFEGAGDDVVADPSWRMITYPEQKLVDDLWTWLELYGLQIEDLDELLFQVCGYGLLSCDDLDMDTMKRYVFPKLTCSRRFREDYVRKAQWMGLDWLSKKVYAPGKFQYPYILEKDWRGFMKMLDQELAKIKPIK